MEHETEVLAAAGITLLAVLAVHGIKRKLALKKQQRKIDTIRALELDYRRYFLLKVAVGLEKTEEFQRTLKTKQEFIQLIRAM